MAERPRSSWGPLAFIFGALAVCCGGLPLIALASVAGGGATALLTGVLWFVVGGVAIAVALGFLYIARRRR